MDMESSVFIIDNVAEMVQIFHAMISVSDYHVFHRMISRRHNLQQQRKNKKSSTSWKFKYTNRAGGGLMMLDNYRDRINLGQNETQDSIRMKQLTYGAEMSQLKHKWKSKLLPSVLEMEFCLVTVVKQDLQKMRQLIKKSVVAGTGYAPVKFLVVTKPFQSLLFLKQNNKSQFLWYLEVFSIIPFHMRRQSSATIQLFCDVVKFQFWHKWRLCGDSLVVITMSDTNFAYSVWEQQRQIQSVLDQIVGYKVERGILFILSNGYKLTHSALIFTTFKNNHKTVLETTDSHIPKHSCTVFDRGKMQQRGRHKDPWNLEHLSKQAGRVDWFRTLSRFHDLLYACCCHKLDFSLESIAYIALLAEHFPEQKTFLGKASTRRENLQLLVTFLPNCEPRKQSAFSRSYLLVTRCTNMFF